MDRHSSDDNGVTSGGVQHDDVQHDDVQDEDVQDEDLQDEDVEGEDLQDEDVEHDITTERYISINAAKLTSAQARELAAALIAAADELDRLGG